MERAVKKINAQVTKSSSLMVHAKTVSMEQFQPVEAITVRLQSEIAQKFIVPSCKTLSQKEKFSFKKLQVELMMELSTFWMKMKQKNTIKVLETFSLEIDIQNMKVSRKINLKVNNFLKIYKTLK